MSFENKDSTSDGRKFWNGLKKFSSLFKRHSSTNDKGGKKMSRIHSARNCIIHETIEEMEMENLESSSLPNTEELDSCLDVVAYLDKQVSVDECNVFKKSTTSLDSLFPSKYFQNLNPLMSPVTQKKFIARAKIDKLKNSIQRGWEINSYLDAAIANFDKEKPGAKKVRFSNPPVSEIFDGEEDPGTEISLSERIQIFMGEVDQELGVKKQSQWKC
ncbi:uncharacterized protein LOC117181742 [Belonocnema kinseyi]|uniref:uncharacterized protein LOC117181742 n=1 Tax=Belonocnema kinseyi TaxID=2817044 RepID=UPI00143D4E81|nr:uncharacterized protein LOC117181742 [Belonocnema kinseyi]